MNPLPLKMASANNGIRALTGDLVGNLWLGTNDGIIQFNPDSKKVKNYLIFGGKVWRGKYRGGINQWGGRSEIIGTTDGLIAVDAQKLTTNLMPPPVALTDFKIFARSVSIEDSDSLLTKAVDTKLNVSHWITPSACSRLNLPH